MSRARVLRRPRARPLPLTLKALRWRLPLSIAVWACAVVVCGGAALGPLFAAAANESGLQDELIDAGADTGLRLQGADGGSFQLTPQSASARLGVVEALPAIPHRPVRFATMYDPTIGTASGVEGHMNTTMVWREGACAQVVLVSGRCPSGPDEAMVSARSSAQQYGWNLHRSLLLGSVMTRIVGVYRPIDTTSPNWSGEPFFQFQITSSGLLTDAVFVSRGTFSSLPSTAIVQAWTDLPLDVASVRLSDVAELRHQLVTSRQGGIVPRSSIASVLDRADVLRVRIELATALVVLQLCVLGWLVLFQVLVDAVEGRSADIALAKLRGFPRGQLLRFGLGEPTLLLLAAIPAGAAVAFAGGSLLSAAVLRPGTPVTFPALSVVTLLLASLGGFLAVAQSARRVLSQPVLSLWRRTRSHQRSGRRGLAIDIATGVVALIAFALLRTAGPTRTGPLVLLAPGLLVVALGIAGARLLPVALRPFVRLTAWGRRVPLLLAVRQITRRPAAIRLVALLTVAVGLAVFGVGGETVAVGNRETRAAAELGAQEVVPLQTTLGEDVVSAVHRADPSGRWAAAAATWIPDGGGNVFGFVLAIDATRLPRIGLPATGLPAPVDVARVARADAFPAIDIRGRRITATIALTGLHGGPAPTATFDLRRSDSSDLAVPASTALRAGAHEYSADVPCARGCTLAGITWSRSLLADRRVTGSVSVSSVEVDGHGVPARLTTGKAWHAARPDGNAADAVRAGERGLEDRFVSDFGGSGGVSYSDVLDPVPAIVTPAAVSSTKTGAFLQMQAQDGSTAQLRVDRSAAVLPSVLDDGVITDVRSLQVALPDFTVDATWSVWLGPDAPADALARLRAAGLVPDGHPVLAADRRAELARQGPALALLLLLVTALSGVLLAVGGTSVSIGAAVRRRSYEGASLRVVGITRAQVFGAGLLEQVMLLGTALVVGLPAGLATLAVVLPEIPEFPDETPVPLDLVPPALPIVAFALAFAAVVTAASAVSAARIVRDADGARLREAEE